MRTVSLVAGLAVAAWLLLVFGSALARSDAIEKEASAARAANQKMHERIAAGQRENELIQTDAFLSFQSRVFAMGEPGERPFALELGAPPPRLIVPLGSEARTADPPTPLEQWLELLFG